MASTVLPGLGIANLIGATTRVVVAERHSAGLLPFSLPAEGCCHTKSRIAIACSIRAHGGLCRKRPTIRASASNTDGDSSNKPPQSTPAEAPAVFDGVYGPWTIEDSDKAEVLAYRAALVISTASFILAASTAFLPSSSAPSPLLLSLLDPLYFTAAASLGVALILIHIYVTPLKRFLQLLWLTGSACSVVLLFTSVLPAADSALPAEAASAAAAASPPPSLVLFCLQHPATMWAVGPLFAALTGLVFKEGLCYGKLEAALLTLLIPTLCLGHLSGLMPDDAKRLLLGVWVLLAAVFAARKFSQPIKDDIGDKSVFQFQALSPEEQEQLLRRLQQQKAGSALSE